MTGGHLCGPWEGGLNKYIPQATFGIACAIHDEDYTTNPAGLTREQADNRFLCSMLALSEHTAHKALAVVYYAAVRAFGWRYFRG